MVCGHFDEMTTRQLTWMAISNNAILNAGEAGLWRPISPLHAPILRCNGNNVRTVANFDPMLTNAITSRILQNIQSLECFLCLGVVRWLRRKRTKSFNP